MGAAIFGCGRSHGIGDWLWFWGGVAQCGKSLVAIFWKLFASINKILNFVGELGTGLSLCEV